MKRKIVYGHMGNGVTVWDELAEELIVAHIDVDRTITYRLGLEKVYKEQIKFIAKHSNITISATQDDNVFNTKAKTRYVITGILKNGKRFNPIYTTSPQHYNIWKGSVWELVPDFINYKLKRKLILKLYR